MHKGGMAKDGHGRGQKGGDAKGGYGNANGPGAIREEGQANMRRSTCCL